MKTKNRNIYLIDGNALCYRAYYAIRELTNSKGRPTNAIYGFINMLRKIFRDYEPEMMTVVFDSKGPTSRHEKYEDYKIHRKPMPDDLVDQLAGIRDVVMAHNIPICQLAGYEADDIIATLAEKAKGLGVDVTIVTSDKDAMQLVGDKVKVLSAHTSGDKLYGAQEVVEKFGVTPELMVDYMALVGDASDNVPGVKGVGKVTACKLINEHGSLEGVYKKIEDIKARPLKEKLLKGRDMAELSRELVVLDREVPVTLDLEASRVGDPDAGRLAELYKEFEFGKLLEEVMPEHSDSGDYSVVSGKSEIEGLIKEIKRHGSVAFAIEKNRDGDDAAALAFSYREGKACKVPLINVSPDIRDMVREVMEDDKVEKIGHDIKRAIGPLALAGISLNGRLTDVMISDYLIDPSLSKYTLESMAARHLGYKLPETDDVNWTSDGQGEMMLEEESRPGIECERADIILRLYAILMPVMKNKELDILFRDVEMPLVRVLAYMEEQGVTIDTEFLHKQSIKIEKKLDEVSDKIFSLAGEEFNINSPKQLQVILYDKLGLPVTKKTKTGASTDESVLTYLAAFHELPALLLEYRELSKLKTGYYDSILGMVGRPCEEGGAKKNRRNNLCTLHARFNQAVTATGRLSSSEPNLQNIPIKTKLGKEIRKAFVPGEKGNVLLAADYSQIELRILAHLSDDECLIKAFEDGEDVHRYTASLIFDVPLSEVKPDMRAAAKTVNFGIVYGMSAFGLSKDLGIGVGEAQGFINAYFKRYKGVSSFTDDTIKEARKKGYVTTLLNRRRYIPDIKSSNDRVKGFAERVAVNTPVQGSAADVIKLAMIECYKEFAGTDIRMIIQVHDELVFDVPEKKLKETARRVTDIMEQVLDLKVPLKVDVEYGKNWLEMEEIGDGTSKKEKGKRKK